MKPRLSEIVIPELSAEDLEEHEETIREIAAPIDIDAIPLRKPKQRRQAQ